jgi:ankyrin repeat protein
MKSKKLNIINELDSNGYNLFHRAIISGNKELALDFISQGADLYKLTKYNRTPLELALYYKENEIAMIIWREMSKIG